MDAQFWDEMYGSRDQLFSGAPNGVLVTEVSGLPPGRALDMGCGEGADAIWLARNGWQVTGTDISGTALRRAGLPPHHVNGLDPSDYHQPADIAVGPAHTAAEAAHDHRVVGGDWGDWGDTRTFAYPPRKDDWNVE